MLYSATKMVFKFIEIIGASKKGFDESVQDALKEAARTVKGIEWLEVVRYGGVVDKGGKIKEYQATVKLAFKVQR